MTRVIFLANGEPDLTIEQVETEIAKSLDLGVIPAYAHEVIVGILARKSETEADINKHPKKGWRLRRVNRILVAIIGVTIFEVSQSDMVSAPATVNEALILREEFDDPKSRLFINGTLTNFTPSE